MDLEVLHLLEVEFLLENRQVLVWVEASVAVVNVAEVSTEGVSEADDFEEGLGAALLFIVDSLSCSLLESTGLHQVFKDGELAVSLVLILISSFKRHRLIRV